MPKHFLYAMDPAEKAPAGDGDTESWFRYYKWEAEGEIYVVRRQPFIQGIAPDDFLWFGFIRTAQLPEGPQATAFVFGGAPVLRVEQDSRVQEIWFRSDDVLELDIPMGLVDYKALEVSADVVALWTTRKRNHP